MINSFKLLKLFLLLVILSACNTSGTLDNDILITDNSESNIIENQELNNESTNQGQLSLLALGDSYTIGEGVNEDERWPNQFVQEAYENGIDFLSTRIIAETGLKTSDLINGIESSN